METDVQHAPLLPVRDTDEELMRRVIQADQQAFEILVQRYHSLVFKQAFRYLEKHELSEDVTQSVFLQLYLSHPLPREIGSRDTWLRAWLQQVTYTKSIDALRLRQREKKTVFFSDLEASDEEDASTIASMQDGQALPEDVVERRDLEEALLKAIEGLPPKFRSTVFLRYTEELTYPEIGQALKIPIATAKHHIKRAHELLQKALVERI